MATRGTTGYQELKAHLSPPARRVVEELIDTGLDPRDVLRRVACDELRSDQAAYAYVREVLYRSLLELTGGDVRQPLHHTTPPALQPADPIAAG